jgi:catechol 2,3-dioxygenase-like lactoylglutathione lyase family enzyme
MIDHTGIGVADIARSAAFYDAALGALGLRRVMQLPENDGADGVGYGVDYPVFWIDRFHPHGVKQHTAFAARNRAEVDAFHAAALKAGGTDNGPPGLRDTAKGYRQATTPPSCSIRTATTWRRSSAAAEVRFPPGGDVAPALGERPQRVLVV